MARDHQTLVDNATSDVDKVRLLAVKAEHGSKWIFALPISPCDLRTNNEAVRIANGLRLGLNLRKPHSCSCAGAVDAKGLDGISCKRTADRSILHQQLNDLVWRALRRANTPSVKEPSGLLFGEDKRHDGLTLVSWQGGRCLAWDAMATFDVVDIPPCLNWTCVIKQ